MTVNPIIGDSKNNIFANLGKPFFAWMRASSTSKYDKIVSDRKRSIFANFQGKVLEISPGIGANLPYYPKDIHWIGIEPNPDTHYSLRKQAEKLGLNIDIRIGSAEWLDAEDNSIDTVVSTLLLCSVPNIDYTLQAILRVLKPGGRFLFIEHIAAPQSSLLQQVQNTVSPIWKAMGDGCHLEKETWIALGKAGFSSITYERFDAQLPIVSPHVIGVATK